MPTMILVEDESFERNSLANFIDWSLVGIEIIGEAANGSQGFTLVENLRPDIVLTDVKMPIMNGIELSKKIRLFAPETEIIFLSSYDDFEYAQQAIDLNVQAYVMKPINEVELLRIVKKAADAITEKNLERRMYNDIRKQYRELLQRSEKSHPEQLQTIKRTNKHQIADEVEKIILEQYSSPLTLEAIAKLMHFTPNYLGTVFKSVKKMSVNRFLMKTRIAKAEELLINSKKTNNEVADSCGFSSLTYFHTIFKKETGHTPSDFRQRKIEE